MNNICKIDHSKRTIKGNDRVLCNSTFMIKIILWMRTLVYKTFINIGLSLLPL